MSELLRGREPEPRNNAPAICAYLIRHGETSENKNDPKRGLTAKGIEQSRGAAERIAGEIQETYPKDVPVELRGYDSGQDRANQTLIAVATLLRDRGYNVVLPKAKDAEEETRYAEAGFTPKEGPGIRSKIRSIQIAKEARPYLYRKEKEEGIGPVMVWLTEPEEELAARGIEGKDVAFARVEKGVEQTARIASRIREQKRHVVAIATTHGGTLEGYATKKLGLTPKALGEIENCEGLKMEFPGDGTPPRVRLWGEHAEDLAKRHAMAAESHIG